MTGIDFLGFDCGWPLDFLLFWWLLGGHGHGRQQSCNLLHQTLHVVEETVPDAVPGEQLGLHFVDLLLEVLLLDPELLYVRLGLLKLLLDLATF